MRIRIQVNLSKSGIGTSVGVTGFRVGVRPNGRSYIHSGRYGLYYRQELGNPGGGISPQTTPSTYIEPPRPGTIEYSTASSQELVPQSKKDLLDKLNQSYTTVRLDYVCGGIGVIPSFIVFQNSSLAGWIVFLMAIIAFILVARWETKRRTIVLDYDFEDKGEYFQKIISSFNALTSNSKVWSMINSRGINDTHEWKRNAGASSLVSRTEAQVGEGKPPWVETNIDVPVIKTRGQSLYLMPDGILVYDSKGVGFVEYHDMRMDVTTTRFIEGSPPHDARVVDKTWKHPNKNGGPDRRFKSNYQIPICLWGVFIKDLDSIDVEEDGKIKAQRLNVGFSRAKERMHFVVSKPLDDFKGSIGDALRHYWNELEEARKEPLPDSVDPNSPMEKEVLNWITQTNFWTQNKGLGRVSLVPQFNIGEYLRQLDPTRMYQHPKYKVDFLLVYKNEKEREHKIVIEYDGFKEHFTNHSEVNEFNYNQYYSPQDVYRQKTLESYGYKFIRINRFNSGKKPIETLDKRLAAVTLDKNGDVDVLRSIHETIENMQNNGAKVCPKCKVIHESVEFKDPACSTGQGRICVYCKGIKKISTSTDGMAHSGGRILCPKCKSVMILRLGRHGKFYGCSRHPICDAVVPFR